MEEKFTLRQDLEMALAKARQLAQDAFIDLCMVIAPALDVPKEELEEIKKKARAEYDERMRMLGASKEELKAWADYEKRMKMLDMPKEKLEEIKRKAWADYDKRMRIIKNELKQAHDSSPPKERWTGDDNIGD